MPIDRCGLSRIGHPYPPLVLNISFTCCFYGVRVGECHLCQFLLKTPDPTSKMPAILVEMSAAHRQESPETFSPASGAPVWRHFAFGSDDCVWRCASRRSNLTFAIAIRTVFICVLYGRSNVFIFHTVGSPRRLPRVPVLLVRRSITTKTQDEVQQTCHVRPQQEPQASLQRAVAHPPKADVRAAVQGAATEVQRAQHSHPQGR